MNVRTTLLAASVALLAFAGCGGDRNDNTVPGSDAGCTANCGSGDSGTPDSGTPDSGTPDSGTPDSGTPDGGVACQYIPHSDGGVIDATLDPNTPGTPATLAQLRYGKQSDGGYLPTYQKVDGGTLNYGAHVAVSGVVVHDIDYVSADGGTVEFWVVDPNDPTTGFWGAWHSTDSATPPAVGDVVNIDGFLSTPPTYVAPPAYRLELTNAYNKGVVKPMTITTTASATPPAENAADAGCTFDAQEGQRYMSEHQQAFAGTRLHINGPLTLTNPNPVALSQVSVELDGGMSVTGYRGFEVTGGILVADQSTYNKDGGFGAANGRCDWAALARSDGGTVTFANGISGVWDTYSMSACQVKALSDGGTTCYGVKGYVPNPTAQFPTMSGTTVNPPASAQDYTFVLYPQTCADLPGDAGAGVTP